MPPTTLTATFRVVTPMFLGGAEPTHEAEIRLPSFKGALRFWWRALAWSEIRDLAEMREREASIFGSSEVGQSRILMRLHAPLTSDKPVSEPWVRNSWEQYVGYGLGDKGDRPAIRHGQEWTVEMNLRRCDTNQSAQVVAALKLLGLVGGLGSRARNGWGSVTLMKLEGADWLHPSDGAGWLGSLRALIPGERADTTSFTAFSKSGVWNCGPIQHSPAAAQKWLGQLYQKLVKETEPKADRAQFGLPREFRGGTPPRRERRASPLFLHIHDCGNGQALPTALWLPSDFLRNEVQIPSDGASARQFVEKLSASPTATTR